ATHEVVPIDAVEDPGAVAASAASSQLLSDAGQRSVLDRRLDEVEALASFDIVEDPDAVGARVASSQAFSNTGPRSVLDRLLDDVEALGGADEVAHDAVSDRCDAGCERGAAEAGQGSPEATRGQREASSLRDRAAAARRAFNRADALVAVAQGHLRGDRPERAPIEVVLTIPASSLRAGATLDPVEVGEMGEAFLSSEPARRLSCEGG